MNALRSLAWAVLLAGCTATQEAPPASSSSLKQSVTVRGRIVEIRGADVVIEHEEIPGEMAAMTMPFSVAEGTDLTPFSEGDVIAFRYTFGGGSSWISVIEPLSVRQAASLRLASAPAYGKLTDASLFAFPAAWTDQDGRRTTLRSFGGRPVLLSMIFTRCGYACPMIIHDMKRIAEELPEAVRRELQFVLVSLDPERDTPETLTRFAAAHGLDIEEWTLLRGSADDVRTLAAMIGLRYRKQADGQFAHTSLISILDSRGEVIHQQKGAGGVESETLTALTAAR